MNMADADFVIAGAGHNSLITAAYLARAGYSVVILEAQSVLGGGASTEDLLMPGVGIDTCSTGHTLIRVNPLIKNDELGLVSDYGLSYVDPDPVAHVCLPDGEAFTMSLDQEKTIAEFARFSQRDAEAYARMLEEWSEVRSIFGQDRFRPIGYGPSTQELLDAHPRASVWNRRRQMSAYDIIMREFETPHCQSFMMWMAFQTLVAIDRAGTGLLAYSLVYGRQQNSWSIPIGGSARLIDGLVGYLGDKNVEVHRNQEVAQLIIDDGRCVGVETTTGERFIASKGVISTIHVKHLVDMAPAELWGEDFLYGVDTYEVGISGFAAYLATTEPPVFDGPTGARTSVSAGIVGWPEQIRTALRNINDGVEFDGVPFLLVATPTLVDAERAVDGLHTVKLLSAVPYEVPAGETWETQKEILTDRFLSEVQKRCSNFTSDKIIGRIVRSPDDLELHNAHMIRGAFHGGDRTPANSGANRPVPGWAQHRMPIPGLYQTGGTTHPGGSITGGPGRNAAIIVLEDLGHNPSEML